MVTWGSPILRCHQISWFWIPILHILHSSPSFHRPLIAQLLVLVRWGFTNDNRLKPNKRSTTPGGPAVRCQGSQPPKEVLLGSSLPNKTTNNLIKGYRSAGDQQEEEEQQQQTIKVRIARRCFKKWNQTSHDQKTPSYSKCVFLGVVVSRFWETAYVMFSSKNYDCSHWIEGGTCFLDQPPK